MNDRAARTAQNRIESLARSRETEIDNAFLAFMSHPQGRRAINWLIELTEVGKNPYTRNALDTAFQCGQHNIGLQLMNRVQSVAPELFMKMVKEINDERQSDADTLARAQARGDTDPYGDSEGGTEE